MKRFFVFLLITTPFFSSKAFTQIEPKNQCCISVEKKWVNCECFVPKVYNLPYARNFFISVDFLYWFAKETGLSYALKTKTIEGSPVFSGGQNIAPFVVAPKEFKYMKASWDPGFRIALGWNDPCDGWDLNASWTYYHTKRSESASVKDSFVRSGNGFPLGESLLSPWILPEVSPGSSTPLDFFNIVKATWSLYFHQVDLELGKGYRLSPSFSMRPFLGIRGGWTKTQFDPLPILDLSTAVTTVLGKQVMQFTNRFYGIGLLAGIEPNWHLPCGFSIYGKGNFALLWGRFKSKRREKAEIQVTNPFTSLDEIEDFGEAKSSFSNMQAILDLGLGLRWESFFSCDRYRLAIDVGWEHHMWFDHNHRMQLRGQFELDNVVGVQQGVSFIDYDETYGNLVFGGLIARIRFDF